MTANVTAVKREESVAVGGLMMCLAFFAFAAMGAFGKAATGAPASLIVFFQNGIAFLLMLPWALRHGTADLKTKRMPLLFVRAFAGLFTFVLMFVALKDMSLIGAMVLSQATPLFIPLIALAWLKEKITGMVWLSVAIGLVGVLIYLRPSPTLLENPAALIATAAAFLAAIALISVHQLAETEKPDTILFYYFLINTIAIAPFAIAQWQEPQGVEWLYLLGVGVTMALTQIFLILAYQHASAQRLASFNYSVVIFSGLIGWIVWNHVPDAISFLGILIICAGGLLSVMFGGAHGKAHAVGHGHWRLPPKGGAS